MAKKEPFTSFGETWEEYHRRGQEIKSLKRESRDLKEIILQLLNNIEILNRYILVPAFSQSDELEKVREEVERIRRKESFRKIMSEPNVHV